MPRRSRVPKLLIGDSTPESLAWRLSHEWPSGGVILSEAGSLLGAHGMTNESVMSSLALFSVLWDGGEHRVGRRTSESFFVAGARLTKALQIQERNAARIHRQERRLGAWHGLVRTFPVGVAVIDAGRQRLIGRKLHPTNSRV